MPDAVKLIIVLTLIMGGEKSMPFMRPTADRVAALVPGAQRKTLQGQTHQAAPEAVAPLLIEFFASGARGWPALVSGTKRALGGAQRLAQLGRGGRIAKAATLPVG